MDFTAGLTKNTKIASNKTDPRAGNQTIPRVASKPHKKIEILGKIPMNPFGTKGWMFTNPTKFLQN
jgi:hypothetical protein